METQLTKAGNLPSIFDGFFRTWNSRFDNGDKLLFSVPAVNITDNKDDFTVCLAVPGMKKSDFNIDVDGNMLTISCEKEEEKHEKEVKFTRREYSYSSFSRSFTIPEEVQKDKIDAHYEDGLLKLTLPKKEEVRKLAISKQIAVK